MSTMRSKLWQWVLLGGAVVSLVIVTAVLLQIVFSPVIHGRPARILHVFAGPYQLRLTLYAAPANAGYALPFAIAQAPGTPKHLTYTISALPGPGVHGSVVQGDINQQARSSDGIPGSVYITVQGPWFLRITVDGPAGQGQATVPITATAPPAIPPWLAWSLGYIPLYGILLFLGVQWWQRRKGRERQL